MRHAWLIGLAIVQAGCDPNGAAAKRSSITVPLPPARPATPSPGFSRAIDTDGEQIRRSVKT
jgi:hypothetical protein